MEAFIGLGQLGEAARLLEVEGAALDQHAADGGAMSAQELGRGMVEQAGAEIERAQQVGRGEGRIDQQRDAVVLAELRQRGDVEHVQPRVAQRLAEQQFGIGADRGAPGVDVARLDEGGLDAEAAQRVVQQVVRAAVQRRRGHHVRAGAHQRGHGEVQRGLARGGGDRAGAVLQRCDALFQHGHGRVGDARIDVARALHVEQRRRVLAVAEHEGGGQVDGGGARPGGGVGRGAGVQRQRIEAGSGHGRSGVVISGQHRSIVRTPTLADHPQTGLLLYFAGWFGLGSVARASLPAHP
ncbi:hypothetical protein D3C81_1016680 [compost metagenome]